MGHVMSQTPGIPSVAWPETVESHSEHANYNYTRHQTQWLHARDSVSDTEDESEL